MMRLLLARHGETAWNADGRIQGDSDVPLSARGRSQAEELGRRLRESGEQVRACYASSKRRAQQTARLACLALGADTAVTPVDALREISFGAWEGHTWDAVREQWAAEYAAYRADRRIVRPPGGESYGDLHRRVLPALRAIQRSGEGTALVVCHSAVIASVCAWQDGTAVYDDRFLTRYRLENCAWTALSRPL